MRLSSMGKKRLVRKGSTHAQRSFRPRLERLEDRLAPTGAAGSLDPTFGIGGKQTIDFGDMFTEEARGVAVQADGKIVAAGSSFQGFSTGLDFAVTRLNSDGSLDTTFGSGGKQTIDFGLSYDSAESVALQAD